LRKRSELQTNHARQKNLYDQFICSNEFGHTFSKLRSKRSKNFTTRIRHKVLHEVATKPSLSQSNKCKTIISLIQVHIAMYPSSTAEEYSTNRPILLVFNGVYCPHDKINAPVNFKIYIMCSM